MLPLSLNQFVSSSYGGYIFSDEGMAMAPKVWKDVDLGKENIANLQSPSIVL
jgi:hypothetical protein